MLENLTLADGNDGILEFVNSGDTIRVEDTNLMPYTGWPTTPGVTLSFDNGTETFTVTDGGSAYYYIQGVRYVLGGNKTVSLPGGAVAPSAKPQSRQIPKLPTAVFLWNNLVVKAIVFTVVNQPRRKLILRERINQRRLIFVGSREPGVMY